MKDWDIAIGMQFVKPYLSIRRPDEEADLWSIFLQFLGLHIYLAW